MQKKQTDFRGHVPRKDSFLSSPNTDEASAAIRRKRSAVLRLGDNPIGVLDSGVGGLTILGALRKRLPEERFVYVCDARAGGWGSLSDAQIFSRVQAGVEMLLKENCKLIVLACNTATSVCIERLREAYAIPFVGVEPALKPARAALPHGKLLLLCTPATARTARVARLLALYGGQNTEVFTPATLAADIEKNFLRQDALTPFVEDLLRAHPADGVILGCTHYVFLRPAFERTMGSGRVFDGGEGTARRVEEVLAARSLRASDGTQSLVFYTIGRGD